MEKGMVCIPKREYEDLKLKANIDVSLMKQLVSSFKDIGQGRVRRVK